MRGNGARSSRSACGVAASPMSYVEACRAGGFTNPCISATLQMASQDPLSFSEDSAREAMNGIRPLTASRLRKCDSLRRVGALLHASSLAPCACLAHVCHTVRLLRVCVWRHLERCDGIWSVVSVHVRSCVLLMRRRMHVIAMHACGHVCGTNAFQVAVLRLLHGQSRLSLHSLPPLSALPTSPARCCMLAAWRHVLALRMCVSPCACCAFACDGIWSVVTAFGAL